MKMPNMCPFEKIENLLNNFRKKNFVQLMYCKTKTKKNGAIQKIVSPKKTYFSFFSKGHSVSISFLFPSVVLSCYYHLKAILGMYLCPSIFEHFGMV